MATGLIKANSKFAIEEEVTEGTYVAPSATTKYLQVLEGVDLKPSIDVVDRGLLTASPGKETPRNGMRSVQASIPVEFRASGTEGAETDFDSLFKSALGTRRQNTTRVTARAGVNTSTSILIEDADISKFNVGDVVLVMRSGMHELRPVTAKSTGVGTATITLGFALTNGAPPSGVQLAKFTTYLTADGGHVPLSFSQYLADEVRQAAIGCKVTQMALQNFTPGKVASWSFSLDGLSFTETDGVAPQTPAYDSGLPPIILSALVFRNGTSLEVNQFGVALANSLGFITATSSANGKVKSRVKSRDITGSFNPYKDDTATTYFDDWKNGTEFSMFVLAYTPSSTSGEMTLGSICSVWLPQCFATGFASAEQDGILVDNVEFRATRGSTGVLEEMYLGHI